MDRETTIALQSVASWPLDLLANLNTIPGQLVVTVALALALAFVAWRREPGPAWAAAAAFAAPALLGLGLKLVLVQPPPPADLVRSFWDPLGVSIATPSSFPSGHVARLSFLAVLAGGLFQKAWVRIALAVFILYTCWARVYVGAHWLSDSIGGLALGIGSGSLALAWIMRCRKRHAAGSPSATAA